MRQSKLFYKTQKSLPEKIEVISHRLLLKAGFIDQLASGIYNLLPLGFLVHKKIEKIIREEMLDIGAQELLLASLHPKDIWEATNRWETMEALFKLKDRHKKDFALGPTHEEVIVEVVKKKIFSWKDLPLYLFQIQTKFRNEIRFFGGLLRAREFVMKDLYSFHRDQKDFEKFYQKVIRAYCKIFKRCQVRVKITEASAAGFSKGISHEFQVLTSAGEDTIYYCPLCDFSQNKEIAKTKEGERCPRCQKGKIKKEKGIEVANIFPLGTKYSQALGAYFVDRDSKRKPIIMGCYGIGLGRLMATIVEVNHDENGIIWPKEVAPFLIHLIPVEIKEKRVRQEAEKLYQDLQVRSFEVLYDEREEVSPGEKFVEADLLGLPLRVVISKKTLQQKKIEVKERKKKKIQFLSIKGFFEYLQKYV